MNIVPGKDGALACLYGRLDIESSPALRIRLLALIRGMRSGTVTIDMSEVTHIDSSGIATLIEALKIAREKQASLGLQGLHDPLLRLFEFSGVLRLFDGSGRG
jgi:anti-sigma B factor antagonist